MRRLLLLTAIALSPLAVISLSSAAAGSTPTTYYVSPSGSDSNPGTAAAPWKTVNHVNNVTFNPGDTVLFQGGQTFSDATLMPPTSGTSSAPITFGSYGSGRARLSNSNNDVWIPAGHHDLSFNNLDLTGNATLFASAATGSGCYDISITDSSLHDTPQIGVNVTQAADHDWKISNVTFSHIGDSAIIIWGSNVTVSGSTISDAGWNSAISWAKHGIYVKGPDATISGNDISNVPNGQAVSLRFHGARVYDNTIHDTKYAFGFFDYDTGSAPQGTSYVYDNRVWGISGWGFYYSGQADPQGHSPSVGFVIANNTFSFSSGGEAVNLSEVPSGVPVQLANNVFTGSFGSAYRGCSSCSEFHNDWNGGTSNLPSSSTDIKTSPSLSSSPSFSPSSTSPVIDAGTTSVNNLSYSASCDGSPLHYCGTAPDMGASEYLSSSSSSGSGGTGSGGTGTGGTGTGGTGTGGTGTGGTGTGGTGSGGTGSGGTSGSGGSTPPPDTTAPTAPGSLALSHGTLSWSASTDDVGVTGYRASLNGSAFATTTSLSTTSPQLACGSSYTFGVVAFDAAGNTSPSASLAVQMPGCGSNSTGGGNGKNHKKGNAVTVNTTTATRLSTVGLGATFGRRALQVVQATNVRFAAKHTLTH